MVGVWAPAVDYLSRERVREPRRLFLRPIPPRDLGPPLPQRSVDQNQFVVVVVVGVETNPVYSDEPVASPRKLSNPLH